MKQIQGRCHSCLRSGHRAPQCRSKRPCFFCRRDGHHQRLCRQQFTSKPDTEVKAHSRSTNKNDKSIERTQFGGKSESNLSLQTPNSESILQTALATVKGHKGEITARLYFDTGGSRSFISAAAARQIGATCVGQEAVSVGRFRDVKRSTLTYKIFEFEICFPNGESRTVRMSSEKSISCPIQLIPLDPNRSILSQVKLAEPLVKKRTMVGIDILIGNDYYYEFFGSEQTRCSNGVVLLSSPFGYMAGGFLRSDSPSRNTHSSFFISAPREPNNFAIERFWRFWKNDKSIERTQFGGKSESNLSLQTPNSESILQTALATVKGQKGEITARLYFDTGGSRSFISAAAARQIGATCVGQEAVSVGRFRDVKRSTLTYKIFEFEICFPNGESRTVRMSSEKSISCPIQLIPLDPNRSILSQVKLAEPLVKKPTMVGIDILIGNDYYYEFFGSEQTRCSNGVVLLSSPFAYMAGGSLRSDSPSRNTHSSFFISAPREPNNFAIERFWSLEDIGIKENCHQNDDERDLQLFNDSVKFEDGRYAVKWPWRENIPELPDNYGLAQGRLRSLVNRLKSNKSLPPAYDQNIQDQKDKGIIEAAPEKPDGVVHYIPHHCVVTPTKKTTNLRIVYYASAKVSKEALSLNECLYRGPVFLANSVGILLRWRQPKLALVSDIEKAFQQVGLQQPDRDITRFSWVKGVTKPATSSNVEGFRFCLIPFGFISSRVLLAATVLHHLKSYASPTASDIADNVYADNVFGGAETEKEAYDYYGEAKTIFGSAAMNLREWHCNSTHLMQKIPQQDRGDGRKTSVLGLQWDLDQDTFVISVGKLFDPFFTVDQTLRPSSNCVCV